MLITGIGSLPFTDIEQALEYSFQHDLPFLPQLPQLNEDEMMVTQALDDSFDTYACFEPFLYRAIDKKIKKVKLQLAGPITCSVVAEEPIDSIITQLLNKVDDMISPFLEQGIEVLFFIDEPMLFVNFESPLQIQLKNFFSQIKEKGIQVGLHCCSNPDWDPIIDLGVDYLSFDCHVSGNDLIKTGLLKQFKDQGGKVIIGFDPRSPEVVDTSLADYMSFSCGMGTLTHEATYDILRGLKNLKY